MIQAMLTLLLTTSFLIIAKVNGFTNTDGQQLLGDVIQDNEESNITDKDDTLIGYFKQAIGGDKFRNFDWRSHGWKDDYLMPFYIDPQQTITNERILCFPLDQETGRVSNISGQTTEMLAHQMCRHIGHPTYSTYVFRKVKSYHIYEAFNITNYNQSYSAMNGTQREDFSIQLEHDDVGPLGWNDTCAVPLVRCGPCQKYSIVWHGRKVPIHSPMYPRMQPGIDCEWELEGWLNRKMYFNINITDIDFRSLGSNASASSYHTAHLSFYAGDNPNSLEEVISIRGSSEYKNLYRIENKRFLKILFENYFNGDPTKLDPLRGFNLNISVEDHTNRDQYKTVGIVLAFPIGCFVLCCFFGCIRNKCAETRRRRNTRRPRPRMTIGPTYVLEPGIGLHEQRTARLEEELLGTKFSSAGENIYQIDNTVALRNTLPPLPSTPNMCDLSGKEEEKLYETICLHSLRKENAEDSSLNGSLSTPLLATGQKERCSTKQSNEAKSPNYLSLEAEPANFSEA